MIANQHDNETFDLLFRECFKPLCAYCQFKFGLDIDVSKDAVHNAFVRYWESQSTFASFSLAKAYLYKITTNICLDLIRHNEVKSQYAQFVQKNFSEESVEASNELAEYKELQNAIDSAIAQLPHQMRQIFELSRHEGLKYAEIAGRLDLSVKTVETQMSRALKKLREKLAPYIKLIPLLVLVKIF